MRVVPEKTVARLCLYRRILMQMLPDGRRFVRSHDIAAQARVTPAQVRRDIMALGYKGLPGKGYGVQELLDSMSLFIDAPEREEVALVGVGNLGRRAAYLVVGRRISSCGRVDNDPVKDGLVINGCPCYDVSRMADVIAAFKIKIAVLAVPAAVAQDVAEKLIAYGVKGILNFVPVRLHLPTPVHVEDIDISSSLERVSFFARAKTSAKNASLSPGETVDSRL